MTVFQDIRSISPSLSTADLLRFLIAERFPGKTVVTASLMARGVVTLKLVADVDPATPVVFCHAGDLFPESRAYRERVVETLGLTNIVERAGREAEVRPGDHDHVEQMWAQHRTGPGRTFELVHLNDTLAAHDCWISAVYHVSRSQETTRRVDVTGRLIRVDPLIRWSDDEVSRFMRDNKLPFHPRAKRREFKSQPNLDPPPPTYAY